MDIAFFWLQERKEAMATLFKRSDAPLYRVFVGADWELFAHNLSQEQCFELNAVLHAPLAAPDAQETMSAAILRLGATPMKNGWFEATLEEATRVLVAALQFDRRAEQCFNKAEGPELKRRRGQQHAFPVPDGIQIATEDGQCEGAVLIPSTEPAVLEEDGACSSRPDTPKSLVEGDAASEEGVDEDPLWGYVSACSTREAAKATDMRAALEARCGKEIAKSLLARTVATVAQDASGKKNRVLKLGNSYIKLKS